MRFIGYARVSDKEQLKKGFSVEAQQEAIEAWAAELGHTISRVMIEPGRSGSKPSQETRPVFEQAVRLVLAGAADGLVVRWMDRFARNVEDFLRVRSQFFQAGKQLVSISEPLLNGDPGDPVSRYISVAIMNAYQLQAELSGLKAAQGRERRAKQGQYPGLPQLASPDRINEL
ncbi:MAG: recombinase family protein [Anaerolineales bacterium]|nr:recombinase family protein [Anaerolineales bacterium]